MATTITAMGTPKKITLGNTPLATKVTLPAGTARATLYFETNAGRYSNTGTDAVDIGDDFEAIPAGTPYDLLIHQHEHGDAPTLYVASGTNATVVRVTAKAR